MFPGVWIKKMLLFLIVEPYLQTFQNLCVVQGTTAGKYASQRFSASYAALPKGCSAC